MQAVDVQAELPGLLFMEELVDLHDSEVFRGYFASKHLSVASEVPKRRLTASDFGEYRLRLVVLAGITLKRKRLHRRSGRNIRSLRIFRRFCGGNIGCARTSIESSE